MRYSMVRNVEAFSVLGREEENCQRRKGEREGIRLSVARNSLGMKPSSIAHVTPAIHSGIAVDQFAIPPSLRHADPVALAGNRREITGTDDEPPIARPTEEGDD
jgi:hypothetical protein